MTTPERHIEVARIVLNRALTGSAHMGDGITQDEVHAALDFLAGMPLPKRLKGPTLIYLGLDEVPVKVGLAVDDPNPLTEIDIGHLAVCKGLVDCAAVMIRSELDRRFPVRDKR